MSLTEAEGLVSGPQELPGQPRIWTQVCDFSFCRSATLTPCLLGCYKKIPREGGLHNRHAFLTGLEAGDSKIKVPEDGDVVKVFF